MLKIIVYIIATLFALAGSAMANPIKLTTMQAYSVLSGINQINGGYDESVTKDGKEVALHRSFVFAPNVRIALAVNASKLTDAIAPAQKAVKAANQIVAAKDGKIDPEARKALDAEIEKISNEIIEVDLTPISESDLALDKNMQINAATIQLLLPILNH